MRGEEPAEGFTLMLVEELPPHARRRGYSLERCQVLRGITSACAEKSPWYNGARNGPRNYLRMRGEEGKYITREAAAQELPPHARRREAWGYTRLRLLGITSACAEKSLHCREHRL